ncbi:hypothetical protein GIB67_005474 [Kingdonia uniflora]|uniref:Mediator of RNA polymerase II transcription subunit 32 n=1 Tax=Kingdonia uniflora TaxID=39325 RepID=A0A7J7NI15_9MAGN|nr:hypothetical protein GIB67_005474 [Kingdonia uniflora]
MDNKVNALSNAYQEFVTAAAAVFEAKETSGGQKPAATDATLVNFKKQWELLRVACDEAEAFVECVKQEVSLECSEDKAIGSVARRSGQIFTTGISSINVVHLEQMSEAVRGLASELQNNSGAAEGAAGSSLSSF